MITQITNGCLNCKFVFVRNCNCHRAYYRTLSLSFSDDIYYGNGIVEVSAGIVRYIEVANLLNSWLLSFLCKYVMCAVCQLFVFVLCVAFVTFRLIDE